MMEDPVLDEIIDNLTKGLDSKITIEQARTVGLKAFVSSLVELVEDTEKKGKTLEDFSGEKEDVHPAIKYCETSLLMFTAQCYHNDTMADWLPFVIDSILIAPTKEIQGMIRDAANICIAAVVAQTSNKSDILTQMLDQARVLIKNSMNKASMDKFVKECNEVDDDQEE